MMKHVTVNLSTQIRFVRDSHVENFEDLVEYIQEEIKRGNFKIETIETEEAEEQEKKEQLTSKESAAAWREAESEKKIRRQVCTKNEQTNSSRTFNAFCSRILLEILT